MIKQNSFLFNFCTKTKLPANHFCSLKEVIVVKTVNRKLKNLNLTNYVPSEGQKRLLVQLICNVSNS